MSKKRELEELMSIICIFTTTQEATRKTAEKIQNLGYTKQSFPIEELKRWLENGLCHFSSISKREMLEKIENKIQELEEELAKEGKKKHEKD